MRRQRSLRDTVALCAVALLELTSSASQAPDAEEAPAPVVFRIVVEEGDFWSPEWLYIGWELENVTDAPVYICQWPGPAFSHGWEYPEGVFNGTVPGYPHTRKLSRKFFVELKPGEAIQGSTFYRVGPNPTGFANVLGHYRSGQTGKEYRLDAWTGDAVSDPIRVQVPQPSRPDPEPQEGSRQ